jgi:hypothetical protein
MSDDTTSVTAALIGLDGFEVLAAADAGGEVELLFQTRADVVSCPSCGAVARAKDRRPTADAIRTGRSRRSALVGRPGPLAIRPHDRAAHRRGVSRDVSQPIPATSRPVELGDGRFLVVPAKRLAVLCAS